MGGENHHEAGEGHTLTRRQLLGLGLGAALGALTANYCVAESDGAISALPESDLMKATPQSVFVAAMGNFKTADRSGGWGSWASAGQNGVKHQPDVLTPDGRRDIAACYYPAIGAYDMSDPDVAEYHCQLLKMVGVDGISFNLSDYERDPWRLKSMALYVAAMKRYGLKGIVRYENKYLVKKNPDPQEFVKETCVAMDGWMRCLEPVQYQIAGRPVFMFFSFKLSPADLAAWKGKFPAGSVPLILTPSVKAGYRGIIDGQFGWTGDRPEYLTDHPPYRSYVTAAMALSNSAADLTKAAALLQSQDLTYYMVGVSPGFDDIGCWGWGDGPRKVERDNGNVYKSRWDMAVNSGLPLAFIPTWNDWEEGTTIEPAVEYGDQYLAITRDGISRFKRTTASTDSLITPLSIYKVRKSTSDPAAASAMDAASQLIAEGKYSDAEAIVTPWTHKLGLSGFTVWNLPPASR